MTVSETYISFLFDRMKEGVVETKNLKPLFCKKFNKSKATYDRLLPAARKLYKEYQSRIGEVSINIEAGAKAILTDKIEAKVQRTAELQKRLKEVRGKLGGVIPHYYSRGTDILCTVMEDGKVIIPNSVYKALVVIELALTKEIGMREADYTEHNKQTQPILNVSALSDDELISFRKLQTKANLGNAE